MMPKRVARFFKFFIHLRMLTQGAAGFDELFVRLGMLAQGAAGVPLNREFLRFLLVRRVLALGCGSCDTTDVSSWDSGVVLRSRHGQLHYCRSDMVRFFLELISG